ncbi:MAG: GNAT family N-acetyltransferase [Chloroflexi bacterium]|nr:GNAT family N-acetyltransferase [Chloroflexota bacterium]
MSLRPFTMPKDIDSMLEVWKSAARYPDHPEWDMQDEEQEAALDTLKTVKKLWPIMRVLLLISPSMKDMMRGFIWDENGKKIGTANISRRGNSDTWLVSNVAVLPEHRRKGIARKLVEACLQLGKERGAKKIVLDVIDGNLPAQQLYARLGFVNYSGSTTFDYESSAPLAEAAWPAGYTLSPYGASEWKPRFDLTARTAPPLVQEYEPVVESAFRPPKAALILMPLISRFTKTVTHRYKVLAADGQIVAIGRIDAVTKKSGFNNLFVRVDPAHPELTLPLLTRLIHEIHAVSPGRKIEIEVPTWQTNVMDAVQKMGFHRRYGYVRMGLTT